MAKKCPKGYVLNRDGISLVQWLWEENHVPKVVGSNPGTVNWMDIFSHIFVVKIVMILFEKTENKQKRSRGWPIFKKQQHFLVL